MMSSGHHFNNEDDTMKNKYFCRTEYRFDLKPRAPYSNGITCIRSLKTHRIQV